MTAEREPYGEPAPDAFEIQKRIMEMIQTRLQIDIDDPAEELFETGIIDSLALIELLLGIEAEFGVRIVGEDVDIANFRSVLHASHFLVNRISATDDL